MQTIMKDTSPAEKKRRMPQAVALIATLLLHPVISVILFVVRGLKQWRIAACEFTEADRKEGDFVVVKYHSMLQDIIKYPETSAPSCAK